MQSIIGIYKHEHDPNLTFTPEPTSVRVVLTLDGKIRWVEIKGRPVLDFEDYKNFKSSPDSTTHIRHIQSVKLIKKEIQRTYSGRSVEGEVTTEKANYWAKKIFDEFEQLFSDKNNLFAGNAAGNEGGGRFGGELEKLILQGKQNFTEWHGVLDSRNTDEAKIIVFLNQISSLKEMFQEVDGGYVILSIHTWEQLCFLYENTLIDYKVLEEYVISSYRDKVLEGQKKVDAIYRKFEFDTSLREALNIKIEKKINASVSYWNSLLTPVNNDIH